MRTNLKQILIIILIGCFSNAQSQNQNDHLEPVQSIYDIFEFEFKYYSDVRKILLDGLSDSPEVRFQVMPSFFPENVVDIEFNKDNKRYLIKYHRCNEMIWSNPELDKVKVVKYESEIEEESAILIKTLFETAIKQTKHPIDAMMGLDGTNYYFSVNNLGIRTGTIWSPKKGSNMHELVEIAGKLSDLAKPNKIITKLSTKETKRIFDLIRKLNTTGNKG